MVLRLSKSLALRSLAVLVMLGGGWVSWFVWNTVQGNHSLYLEKMINVEGNLIADAIQSDLSSKFKALEFLSERYHASPEEALIGSIGDWSEYLTTGSGILTVAIAENDGKVLWNYHKSTSILLKGIIDRIDRNIINKVRGSFVTLPGGSNTNLSHQFLALWIPVYGEQQQIRRLMIVLRPAPWIRDVLSPRANTSESPSFEMAFSIDGQLMFESPQFSTPQNKDWVRQFEINQHNLSFELSIRPTNVLVSQFDSLPEKIVAALCFLLSMVVSLVLWFLGNAQEKLAAKQMSNDLLLQQTSEARKALELSHSEEQSRKWLLDHLMADTRLSLESLMQIVPHLDKEQFSQHVHGHLRSAKSSTFYLLSLISRINDLNQSSKEVFTGDEEDFDLEQLFASLIILFRPLSTRHNISIHYNIVGNAEQVYRAYAPVLRQFLFEFLRDILSKRENGNFGILISLTKQEEQEEISYLLDMEFTYQMDEKFLQANRGDPKIKLNETLLNVLGAQVTEYQAQQGNLTLNVRLQVQSSDRKLPKVSLLGQEIEIPHMNILLVEDSDINQMIVKEMLTKDGHQVSICENGAQAVAEIRDNQKKYDAVLMDIQMPVMNGIDATIAIREAGIKPGDLPIIAMTANTLKSQVDKYLIAGMQKILTKPIIHADVRNVLASLILDEKNRREGAGLESQDVVEVPLIDKDILEPITKLMTQAQLEILIKSLQDTLNHNVPKLNDGKLSGEKRSRFAHEIKGMSSNAGLTSVAEIASRIEVKLLSGDDCSADIKNLQQTFAKSIRVLNEYLQLEKQKNTGARTS